LDVKDQVVARPRSNPHGNGVESQGMPRLPSDHVVGTCRVTADAESSDEFSLLAIKREATAEDDDSADGFARQGIILLPKVLRIAREGDVRVRRAGDSIERTAGLSRGVNVPARKRKIAGAKSIREWIWFAIRPSWPRPQLPLSAAILWRCGTRCPQFAVTQYFNMGTLRRRLLACCPAWPNLPIASVALMCSP
jgi:hypothetical protein